MKRLSRSLLALVLTAFAGAAALSACAVGGVAGKPEPMAVAEADTPKSADPSPPPAEAPAAEPSEVRADSMDERPVDAPAPRTTAAMERRAEAPAKKSEASRADPKGGLPGMLSSSTGFGAGEGMAAGGRSRAAPPPPVATPRFEKGGLQGGSRDDVGQRQDYLRYLSTYGRGDVHKVDVSQRVTIRIRDDLEQPLPNARVRVLDGARTVFSGTTYANGRTHFFPKAAGLRGDEALLMEVTSQGRVEKRTFSLGARDQELGAVMPVSARRAAPVVDVMFILDTTGSMGDEIARIQLTLLDVAARIQRLEPSATVRYGLTLYRDRGDAYVTQVRDFTSDVRAFLADLQAVEADGGGDTPESLNEGLHAAIHGAQWTSPETPNALRLAVLVADAPPHLDYQQDYDYAREMRSASERGIKIFPVAASGLDDQGEYIFRQIAHHTMGRFVFITYGGGTSHHVGQFANNNLDDLVVGLVSDELADLMGKPRASMRALAMAR